MARTTSRRSSESQEEGSEREGSIVSESGPPAPVRSRKQLFTVEGRPAWFHLYTAGYGALTPDQVDILSAKVQAHGGAIIGTEEDADTIIVQYAGVDILREKYWDSRTVYVEEASFVQMCINSGRYMENLHKPIRKGMGGQITGSKRVAFTAEDDRHLCEYLASVIPDEKAGGRSGTLIYKRLMRSAEHFEHRRWALRHTHWSWRERYRNKRADMDPIIDRMVEENPPRPDGKGLYERSRLFNRKLAIADFSDDEEEEEEAEEDEDLEIVQEQRRTAVANADPRKRRHTELADVDDQYRRPSLQPSKRARHTDVGPRREQISPIEQGRAAPRSRSFPHSILIDRHSSITPEPFELPSDPLREDDDIYVYELKPELSMGDFRPGPRDAGPSGTQRTPSPIASPQFHDNEASLGHHAQDKRKQARPHPAVVRKGAPAAARNKSGLRQIPMSSQATLVASSQAQRGRADAEDEDGMYDRPTQVGRREQSRLPPSQAPTQPHSRSRQLASSGASRPVSNNLALQRTADNVNAESLAPIVPLAQVAKTAARKKRIMVVEMPPLAGLFPKVRNRAPPTGDAAQTSLAPQKAAASPVQGPRSHREEERENKDEGQEQGPSNQPEIEVIDVVPQVQGGETYEQDEVENLLMISKGSTRRSSMASAAPEKLDRSSPHPFELESDELDSDDQRTRDSLLPGSRRASGNGRPTGNLSMRSKLSIADAISIHSDDSDDDVPSSNLRPPSRRDVAVRTPGPGNRSQTASSRKPRVSGTPGSQLAQLSRRATKGSMTSDTDSVPMPGTRAREEKARKEEELKRTPYTPPSGTRAADTVATLGLRNRQVLRTDRYKG